jgi:predicted phosphoribosyltransferase
MFMFLDRQEAGNRLAAKLLKDKLIKAAAPAELLVLSIPRGGVVIGAALAQALDCAHEIIAVKKLGFPGQRELAMGAMAEDGTLALSSWLVSELQPGDDYFRQELERVKSQLEAYIQKFRQGQRLDLQSKTVILADDGIATGETMKAALLWCRSQHPKQVVVAVPICSPRAISQFKKLADKMVFLAAPAQFWAVGQFYRDFGQVSEAEVIEYLDKGKAMSSPQPAEPIAVR